MVSPLFFPGGNIGELAVYGTVNDLAMRGAKPFYLSAGFILEEGLPMETLGNIVTAMAAACKKAGVKIATGDTKVVQKGHGDGIYINTSGLGVIPAGVDIGPANAKPGDVVLVSGTMGDHGIAIMSVREGLTFETEIRSDTAPLYGLVEAMIAAAEQGGRTFALTGNPLLAGCDARRAGGGVERTGGFFKGGNRIRREESADPTGGQRRLRDAGAGPALHCQRGETGGDRTGRNGGINIIGYAQNRIRERGRHHRACGERTPGLGDSEDFDRGNAGGGCAGGGIAAEDLLNP